jgi:hypothetical protein
VEYDSSDDFMQNLTTPEWARYEQWINGSDLDTFNGEWQYYAWVKGGTRKGAADLTNLVTKADCIWPWAEGSTSKTEMHYFFWMNSWFTTSSTPARPTCKMYFDDLYIQLDTRSRIELGDQPVYWDCTEMVIQEPAAWDASGITFKLNHGGFTASQTRYLFVINDNGQPGPINATTNSDVVSAGYAITLE